MIGVIINSEIFFFNEELSILEACELIGIKIPRFCYHQGLSIAGNCRMCLVYLDLKELLVVSCVTPIAEDMVITCSGSGIEKARESIIEFLLLNHPLDCPICDQGGECDLQDQTKNFGGSHSRLFSNKSTVEDKYFSPFIKSVMTRCIHCTRCVRFNSELVGSHFFSTLNRGGLTEIGTYYPKIMDSEISGNVVDLCPVGALTTKTYSFRVRPWELRSVDSIDLSDSLGSNIYVHYTEHEVQKIVPKLNSNINDFLISDKARFSYDSFKSVSGFNLVKHYQNSTLISENANLKNWLKSEVTSGKEKKIFLISEETSFEYLKLIKEMAYKNKNMNIKIIGPQFTHSSNFFYNKENKIVNINTSENTCFLFAVNPRLESALVNTRLRLLTINKNYNLYNFGYKYNSYTKTNFINFDIYEIFKFIEGKSLNLSILVLKTIKPLILFGTSFIERISNIDVLKYYVKKVNPSLIFFNIVLWSNSSSIDYMGLKALNSHHIKKSDLLIVKDSQDILCNRKYIYSAFNKKKVIAFESFNSTLSITNGYVFQIKNFFEKSETFINLEFRPQKTQVVIKESKSFCVYSLLKYFFNTDLADSTLSYCSFIEELAKKGGFFFYFSKKKYINFLLLKNNFNLNKNTMNISTYLIKPQYQCFYTTNYFSKFSINMLNGSRTYQSISNNFIDKV
jgi:NADH-quinone oxidoreductase subunit G